MFPRIDLLRRYFEFPSPVFRRAVYFQKDLWTDLEFVRLIVDDFRKYDHLEGDPCNIETVRSYEHAVLRAAVSAGLISPQEAWELLLPYVDPAISSATMRWTIWRLYGVSPSGVDTENQRNLTMSDDLVRKYLDVFRREVEQPLHIVFAQLCRIETKDGFENLLTCDNEDVRLAMYCYGNNRLGETLVTSAMNRMGEWATHVPRMRAEMEAAFPNATGDWRHALNFALLFAESRHASLPLAADALLNSNLVSIREGAAVRLGDYGDRVFLGVLEQAAAFDPYYYNAGEPGDYYYPWSPPEGSTPPRRHYPVRNAARYAIESINKRGGNPPSPPKDNEDDGW